MPKYDFIIVGQGLAGSILSYILIKRGLSVIIIDPGNANESSRIAAGIYNPITGKKFNKTWLADEIFPFLESFYESVQNEFHTTLIHQKKILRPYYTVAEENELYIKLSEISQNGRIKYQQIPAEKLPFLTNLMGAFEFISGGYVNTKSVLEALEKFFLGNSSLLKESFRYEDLRIENEKLYYHEIEANHIVFCEGHGIHKNPYFNWVPMTPAKGEILNVSILEFPKEHIVNKGIFILPVENNQFRIGATFSWDNLDCIPTKVAADELVSKFSRLSNMPLTTISHQAGVRPASSDRRPIIGRHPNFDRLFIFNGFGSKGVSLIPYFANEYISWVLGNSLLQQEVNVGRFYNFYRNAGQAH